VSGIGNWQKADIFGKLFRGLVRWISFGDISGWDGCFLFRLGRHGWNSVMDETGSCQEIQFLVRGVNESWTDFQAGSS
jgi:hypothetical protein